MTEPTTKAGRTLLGMRRAMDRLIPGAPVDWAHGIRAIEAEAAQAAAAREAALREAVENACGRSADCSFCGAPPEDAHSDDCPAQPLDDLSYLLDALQEQEPQEATGGAVWHPRGNLQPGGYPWPARCLNCDLVTEDPDAYFMPPGWDEEAVDPRYLCPTTGSFHEPDMRPHCVDCGVLLVGRCSPEPQEPSE